MKFIVGVVGGCSLSHFELGGCVTKFALTTARETIGQQVVTRETDTDIGGSSVDTELLTFVGS